MSKQFVASSQKRRTGLTFTPRGPYALGEHPVLATAPDGSAAVLMANVADHEAPDAAYLSCGVPTNTVCPCGRHRCG